MVNFADIFKIATMFLKKKIENSRNLKRTGNKWIKIQSISVLLDMTKDADFRRKNAYVRRTHELFHFIYIFFGPSKNLGKFKKRKICVTELFDAPSPSPVKACPPE